MYARTGLALLALKKGDESAEEEYYTDLLSRGGEMIVPGPSADRLLGILSQTMDSLDQAISHFEDALAFAAAGYRPELAWTCCDYAETLKERDAEGDRANDMSLLDESLPHFRQSW